MASNATRRSRGSGAATGAGAAFSSLFGSEANPDAARSNGLAGSQSAKRSEAKNDSLFAEVGLPLEERSRENASLGDFIPELYAGVDSIMAIGAKRRDGRGAGEGNKRSRPGRRSRLSAGTAPVVEGQHKRRGAGPQPGGSTSSSDESISDHTSDSSRSPPLPRARGTSASPFAGLAASRIKAAAPADARSGKAGSSVGGGRGSTRGPTLEPSSGSTKINFRPRGVLWDGASAAVLARITELEAQVPELVADWARTWEERKKAAKKSDKKEYDGKSFELHILQRILADIEKGVASARADAATQQKEFADVLHERLDRLDKVLSGFRAQEITFLAEKAAAEVNTSRASAGGVTSGAAYPKLVPAAPGVGHRMSVTAKSRKSVTVSLSAASSPDSPTVRALSVSPPGVGGRRSMPSVREPTSYDQAGPRSTAIGSVDMQSAAPYADTGLRSTTTGSVNMQSAAAYPDPGLRSTFAMESAAAYPDPGLRSTAPGSVSMQSAAPYEDPGLRSTVAMAPADIPRSSMPPMQQPSAYGRDTDFRKAGAKVGNAPPAPEQPSSRAFEDSISRARRALARDVNLQNYVRALTRETSAPPPTEAALQEAFLCLQKEFAGPEFGTGGDSGARQVFEQLQRMIREREERLLKSATGELRETERIGENGHPRESEFQQGVIAALDVLWAASSQSAASRGALEVIRSFVLHRGAVFPEQHLRGQARKLGFHDADPSIEAGFPSSGGQGSSKNARLADDLEDVDQPPAALQRVLARFRTHTKNMLHAGMPDEDGEDSTAPNDAATGFPDLSTAAATRQAFSYLHRAWAEVVWRSFDLFVRSFQCRVENAGRRYLICTLPDSIANPFDENRLLDAVNLVRRALLPDFDGRLPPSSSGVPGASRGTDADAELLTQLAAAAAGRPPPVAAAIDSFSRAAARDAAGAAGPQDTTAEQQTRAAFDITVSRMLLLGLDPAQQQAVLDAISVMQRFGERGFPSDAGQYADAGTVLRKYLAFAELTPLENPLLQLRHLRFCKLRHLLAGLLLLTEREVESVGERTGIPVFEEGEDFKFVVEGLKQGGAVGIRAVAGAGHHRLGHRGHHHHHAHGRGGKGHADVKLSKPGMGLFSLLEHENMLDDDGRVAVGRNFGREHHHKHEDSVSTATEAEADELVVRRDPDGHTLREGVEVDFNDLLDLNGQAIPGQKFAAHIFDRVGQGKAEVLQRLSPSLHHSLSPGGSRTVGKMGGGRDGVGQEDENANVATYADADEVLAVLLRCKERSEVFRRVKQVVDAKLREVAERLQNGDARSRKMAALGLVMSPGDDVPSATGRAGAEVEVDAQLFEIVHGLNWLCEYLYAVGSVLNEDLEQALRALPPQLREYVERARRRADLFAFLDEYELRSPEAALQLAGIVAGNVKEAGLNAGENLGAAGRTGEDAGKCKQRTLLTHLSLSEIARAAEETKPFRAFPMMVTRDEQAGRVKVGKNRSGTNAFLYYNELEKQKQKRDDRSMIPEAKQPAFKPLFSDPAVIAKIKGDADIGSSKLRLLFDADRYFDLVDPLDASRSFLPATAIQRENAALAEARAELESELAHLQPEGPFGSAPRDDDGNESGRSKKKSPSPKRPLLSDRKAMDGSTLLAYVAGDGKTPAQEDLDFAFAEEDAGLRARVQGRLKTHNYDGAALFQELNRDYEFRQPPKKSDKKFVKFLDRNRNALLQQIDAEEEFSPDDRNPELLGRLQLRAVSLINGLSRLEGRRARKKRRKDESRSRRSVEEDAALSQLDLKLLFPQLSAKDLNRFSSFAFADTTKSHARQEKLSGILDDKRTPLERFSGLYQRLALASNIRAGRYFFDTERDKILKLQPNAVAGAGGRSSEKRKLLFSELWHEALQRIGRVRMRRFLTAGGSVFGPDAVLEKLYHDKVAWDLLGSAQILSKIKHEHVLKVADVEIVCGGVGGGTPVESAGAAAAFNTGSGGGSSSSTSHPQPFLAGDEVLLKRSALDAMGYGASSALRFKATASNMATSSSGGKYRRHPCEGLVDQILASYPRDRPKLVVKDGVLSVTRDEAYVNRKNYHHELYNKAAVGLGEEDAARQLLPRMTLRVDVVDVLSDTVIGEYRVDVEDLVHSQAEKELRLTERILYDVGTLDEDEAVDGRGMHRVSAAQAVLTGDAGEQRVTSWETPFLDPPSAGAAFSSFEESDRDGADSTRQRAATSISTAGRNKHKTTKTSSGRSSSLSSSEKSGPTQRQSTVADSPLRESVNTIPISSATSSSLQQRKTASAQRRTARETGGRTTTQPTTASSASARQPTERSLNHKVAAVMYYPDSVEPQTGGAKEPGTGRSTARTKKRKRVGHTFARQNDRDSLDLNVRYSQFSSAPASAHEQRASPGGHEQEHDADLNMPGFLTVIRHELRPLHGRELRVPRVLLRDVLLDANDPRFEDFRLLTKFVKAGYQLGVRGSCGSYAQAAANDEAALAEAFEMLKLGEDVGMAGIIKGNIKSGTATPSPMMYYGEEQEGASLQRGRGSELDHASTAELLSLWPVMRVTEATEFHAKDSFVAASYEEVAEITGRPKVRRFVVHRNCVVPEMDAELADVVHDSSLVRPSSFVPLAGPLGIVAGVTGEGRGEDDLPTAAASGVSVPALPLRVRPRNVVMAAAYESALRNCFPGGGGAENGTCSLLLHVAHGEIDAAETELPEDDESSEDPRSATGKTTTGVAERERGAGDDEDLFDPAEEEAEEEPAEEEDLDNPEPPPPGGASSAAKPALYAQLSLDRFAAYEALARKTKKRKRSKRKAGSKRDSGRGRMSNLRSSAAGNVFLEEEDDEEENLALRFAPQAVVAVLSAETGRLLRAQPVLFPCHYLQLERKTSVAAAMRVVDKQPGAEADAAATADARDREADADEVGSHLISELALLRRSPLDEGPPHLLSAKQQTLYAMAQEGYLFRTLGVVRDTSAVTNGRADTGQERTLVSIAVYDYREARVGVAAQDRDHEGETGNDGQITYMVPQEWLAHFQPLFVAERPCTAGDRVQLYEEAIFIATQNSAVGGPGVGGGGGFSFKRGSVIDDVDYDEDFGDVQHRQKTIAQDLKAVARLRQILEVTGNSYSDVVCTAVFDAGWIGSGKRAIVSVSGYTGEALESPTSDADEETDFEREDPPFAGSVVNEMELPLHWLQPLVRIDAAALVERQTAVQLRDVVPARRYRDRVQFIKHHVEQQGATLFAGPVEFGGPVGTEMETGKRVVTTTQANKTHILQARMDSAGKRSMAADAAAFFGAELEGEARELAGKVAFEEEADAHGENQLLKIPGPRLRVQVWQKGFLMREVTLPAAYLAPVIAPGTGSSPASATVGTTLLAQQVKHMQTRTSSSTRSTSARSALLSKIIHRLADEAEREYLHGSFLPGELLQVHSDPAMWPNQKNLLGVTLKELSMGKYDDVRFAQSLSEHAVVAVLVDRQNQAVKVVQLPRSALLPALSQFASFFTPGLEMGGVSPFLHQFTDFLGDESTHYDSSSVTRTRNVLVRAEVEVAAQLNFNSSGNAVAGVSKDNPDSNQLAQAGAGRSFRVLLPGDEILLRPGFALGQALERHITDGAACTVAQVACGGHWCLVHTNVSPEVLRGSVEKNALPSAGVTVLSFAGGPPHVASSDEDTRSVASSAHLFSSEAGDSQSETEAATGRGATARQTFYWVPARFLEIPSPHAELEECALGKHVTTRDVILAHAWRSAARRIRVAFHAILLSLGPTLAEIGTLSRDGCYEIIHIPKQYVKFDDSTLPAASTYDYKAVENIRGPDSKISSGVEEQEVTTTLDENASAAQGVHETRSASLREDDPMRMNTVEQSFASLQKLLAAFPHDASVFLRADPDPSAQLLALLDEMKAFGGLDAPQPGVRPVDVVVDTVYEHRVGVRIVLSKPKDENATSGASGSTVVQRSKEFVLNPSSLHIPHAHHDGGGDAFAGTSNMEVLSAGLPTSTASTAAVNKKYRATARAKAQALNESRPTIFAKKQRVALREVAGLTGAASDPQYAKVRDFVANVPKARVIVHNEDVATRDVSVMLLDVDAMPLERATLRAGLLERYLGDEPLLSGKTPAVFAGSGTGENSSLQTEAHKVEVSIRPVVNYKGYKSALERLRRLQARGDRLLVAERDARKKADRVVVLVHRAYSARADKGDTARLLPNPLVCTEVVPRDCLRLRVGRNSRRKKSRAEGGADHDLELEEDLESFILNEEVKLRNNFGKSVGTVFAPGSEVFLVGRAPASDPACAKFVDTYYKVDGAISASNVRLEVRGQSGANVCVEPVVARKTAGLHASLAAPSPERPFLFPANLLVPAISGEHQDTTMHKPPGTLLQPGGGHAQSQMRANVYRPLQEVLLRDICVSAREFPSVATVRRHIEDSGAVLIIASVLPNDASAAQDGSSSAAAACEKLDIAVMLPAAWRDAQKEAAKRPTVAEADEYYSHLFHDAASSVLLFSAVPSLFFTPRHGFGSSDAQHIVPLQAGEVVRLRSMVWSHFADDGSGNGWTQEELGAITRANALTQERLVVAGYVPGSGAANVEKYGGTPQQLHEQVEVWVFDKLVAEPVLTLVLPVAALEPALVEDSEEALAYRDSQAQHAIQYRDFMTEKILAGAGSGLTQTDKRDASKVADGGASEQDAASSKKNRYAKRKGVRRKQGGSDPKNPLPPIDEEDVEDDAAPAATALVDGDTAPAAAAGTTSDVTQALDAAPPPPRKTFSPLGRYYIASGDRVLISKLNSEGRSKSSTATSNNKRRIGDVADSNPVLQKVKQRSVLDGVEIKVLRYRHDVAEVSLSQPGPDRNSLLDYHRVGEKQEILNVPAYCLLPSIDPDIPDRQVGDVIYLREVFLPAPASGASMSAEEKKNRSVLKGDLLAAELFLRGNSNGLRKMRLMQDPRELDGESLRETVACELLFATDGDDAGSQHGTAVARVVQLPLAALSPAMRPPHTGETAVLRPLVGPTDYEDAVGGVRSLLQSIPDARLFVVRVHHQFAEVCVFVNGMRVIPPGSVGEVGGRARKSQAAAANVKNDGKKEAGELDAAADDDLVDEFEPEPLGTGPGFVAVPLFLLAAVDHRVMAEICAPLKPKLSPLDFLPEVFLTLPAARVDLTAVAHKDPRQDIARTLSLLEKELARAPISIRVLRLVKRAPLRPDSFSTTDSEIEFSYDAEVVVSRNRSAGSSSASGNEVLQSKRLLLPAERLEQARLAATEDLRIGEFVHVRRCCFNHSAFPDIDEARRAVRKGLVFRVLTKLPVAGDAATFFLRVVASSANSAASSTSPKKRAAVSPAVKFSLPHFSVVRWSSPSLGVHVEGTSDSKVAVRLRAIEVDDRWRPEANYLTEVRQGSLYGSVTTHLLTPGEGESMAREAGAKPHLAALDDKAAPDQMKTAAPAKMSRAKRHKNLVSWRADVCAGETVKVVVRQRLPAHLSSLVREAEVAGGEQGKAEDVTTSEKWKQLQDGVRAERQRWAEKSLERVLEIPRAFLEREEDAASALLTMQPAESKTLELGAEAEGAPRRRGPSVLQREVFFARKRLSRIDEGDERSWSEFSVEDDWERDRSPGPASSAPAPKAAAADEPDPATTRKAQEQSLENLSRLTPREMRSAMERGKALLEEVHLKHFRAVRPADRAEAARVQTRFRKNLQGEISQIESDLQNLRQITNQMKGAQAVAKKRVFEQKKAEAQQRGLTGRAYIPVSDMYSVGGHFSIVPSEGEEVSEVESRFSSMNEFARGSGFPSLRFTSADGGPATAGTAPVFSLFEHRDKFLSSTRGGVSQRQHPSQKAPPRPFLGPQAGRDGALQTIRAGGDYSDASSEGAVQSGVSVMSRGPGSEASIHMNLDPQEGGATAGAADVPVFMADFRKEARKQHAAAKVPELKHQLHHGNRFSRFVEYNRMG